MIESNLIMILAADESDSFSLSSFLEAVESYENCTVDYAQYLYA